MKVGDACKIFCGSIMLAAREITEIHDYADGKRTIVMGDTSDLLNSESKVLRRIPDADDPRVLRRALEMAVNEIEARDRYGTSPNPKEKDFIDQARREFESEASDE